MSSLGSLLITTLARRAGICCVLAIISFASGTQAQSGRAPKPKSTPPTTLPTPSAAAAKPIDDKRPTISSLLLINSVSSAKAIVWTNMALKDLAARLQEAPKVKVTQEKDMSRDDAGKLARSRKDAYVVWVQFDIDASMATIDRDAEATMVTGLNPGCLFISYVVFTPGTSAVKAQERVYQEGYRAKCTGTAIQPDTQLPPNRQGLPVTQTLEKAAREAADRILNALALRSPMAFLKRKTFLSGSM